MSKQLLMRFIRSVVREVHAARVPNQLVSGETQDDEGSEEEEVVEFAAVGGGSVPSGIEGFSGPINTSMKRKKRGRRI